MTNRLEPTLFVGICAVAAALVLTACHFPDERPITGATPVSAFSRHAAEFATPVQDLPGSVDAVRDKVRDEGITAAVNNELSRDPELADLLIDVDTVNGHVALRGTAPDIRSRERAAVVAAQVDGVVAVHNQLSVVVRPMAFFNPKVLNA